MRPGLRTQMCLMAAFPLWALYYVAWPAHTDVFDGCVPAMGAVLCARVRGWATGLQLFSLFNRLRRHPRFVLYLLLVPVDLKNIIHKTGAKFLYWMRDVFCPQHRVVLGSDSKTHLKSRFWRQSGMILCFNDWPYPSCACCHGRSP